MDSATYRHVMGQIKKSCTIPHHSIPCHNLVCLETLLKVSKDLNSFEEDGSKDFDFLNKFPCYKPFDYSVQMNYPLHCGHGATDVANDLVKMKLKWEKKLKSIRVHNLKNAVTCIRNLRIDKPAKLSDNLLQYIEHFHNDPEPSFHGSYNWLYTGGNLVNAELDNSTVLISAEYLNSSSGFNIMKLNTTLDKVESKWFCQLKKNSPVLQISCKWKQSDAIICVRQKENASLFRLKDIVSMSSPEKLWRKKVKGSKILTCMGVSDNCQEVIIADSKNDVNVFDIETKAKTFDYGSRALKDSDLWNQVVFGDYGIYMANRKSLYVLDVRDCGKRPELIFTPSSTVNNCEDICSIVKSCSDLDHIYVGTTHNFIQIDVRNGKTIQRWTHLMKNSPQFISCVKDDNSDVVVLQSQQIDEALGITNECITNEEDVNFLSRSLPCALTSIKESLKLARFNGLCLNPFITKRFDFTVTGILGLKNPKGDIHLYIENSGGDIFFSKIRKKGSEEMQTEETKLEILNSMSSFESSFKNILPAANLPKPNDSVNMKHVLGDLKDSDLKLETRKKTEMYWKYHEMFRPESLRFYKDVLAQRILKVWGAEYEKFDYDPAVPSTAKVREWIEKL